MREWHFGVAIDEDGERSGSRRKRNARTNAKGIKHHFNFHTVKDENLFASYADADVHLVRAANTIESGRWRLFYL